MEEPDIQVEEEDIQEEVTLVEEVQQEEEDHTVELIIFGMEDVWNYVLTPISTIAQMCSPHYGTQVFVLSWETANGEAIHMLAKLAKIPQW